MLAVIGLLGILFSSSVIYFLLSRRIRLANCQNFLIINVAVSDVLVSFLGFFRGLGIINSKFVGASGSANITLFCEVYAIALQSLGSSGMLALLPLTLDRAIAIMLPLRHNSIITKTTCVIMFVANWLPILVLLLYEIVAYKTGSITIEYDNRYYRCLMSGTSMIQAFFMSVPFFLILVMYGTILFVIVSTGRPSGRFLITASGIIITSLLAYSPTVITSIWHIPHSYEVSQILTVTVYYTTGVINPLIYVAFHPTTRKYVETRARLAYSFMRRTEVEPSVNPSGFELCDVNGNLGALEVTNSMRVDTVSMPNIDPFFDF